MMISFLRSSSIVLLYVRRGERRSLSDARRRGCPKTFLEFVSRCLQAAETESGSGSDVFNEHHELFKMSCPQEGIITTD